MSVKITNLQAENLKRIKTVSMNLDQNGLTVIGGRNGQGKTSILDAITYALGGERYRPSEVQRADSTIPPYVKLELSNGLIVERKGKNSSLKITDPSGKTHGQKLLDSFMSVLALDLPKFLNSTNKEKTESLLHIIGVGGELQALDMKEKTAYDRRHAIGQIADQKTKYATEHKYFPEAPTELLSISELIERQQAVLLKNAENQKVRDQAVQVNRAVHDSALSVENTKNQIESLQSQLEEEETRLAALRNQQEIAHKSIQELQDESTAELEGQIRDMEDINSKVRANLDKEKAHEDAKAEKEKYDVITEEIEGYRKQKIDLLESADLPLEGLSVSDGILTYQDRQWDCMSGAEQLRVATAIVRKLNPKCGFVLVDECGRMDPQTLEEFANWVEKEQIQVIATRPSTGPDCSIVIEDGAAIEVFHGEAVDPSPAKWEGGF